MVRCIFVPLDVFCWRHNPFALFCFLYLVINSGREISGATTEYSKCSWLLSYWEIGPPFSMLSFLAWMDAIATNSVQILPFGFYGCPRSRFCSCLCFPVLGREKETACSSLLLMKGAVSTIAKCSLWAFTTCQGKNSVFLWKFYFKHVQHKQCSCSCPSIVSPSHLKTLMSLK